MEALCPCCGSPRPQRKVEGMLLMERISAKEYREGLNTHFSMYVKWYRLDREKGFMQMREQADE